MAPKYVNKENKQKEIIKASYSFFIQEGLKNSSMDKLLNKLDMAKGTFYHYFTSKSELLNKLFVFFTKQYIKNKEKELKQIEDFEEKLYSLFDIYLEESDKYAAFFKLYYEYIFSNSKDTKQKEFELEYQNFVKRVLKEIFLEEIKKGKIKKEALVFSETIIYTIDGFLLHSHYLENYSLKEKIKKYFKNILLILKEENELK